MNYDVYLVVENHGDSLLVLSDAFVTEGAAWKSLERHIDEGHGSARVVAWPLKKWEDHKNQKERGQQEEDACPFCGCDYGII